MYLITKYDVIYGYKEPEGSEEIRIVEVARVTRQDQISDTTEDGIRGPLFYKSIFSFSI